MTQTVAAPRPVAAPQLGPSVPALLESARRELSEARATSDAASRYASAHLAGLRAAAAVLAARARPGEPQGHRRPRSVWQLLPQMAPALGEWAMFFSAGAGKRAAARAGVPDSITVREADDLIRDAETFLALVEATLGLSAAGAARTTPPRDEPPGPAPPSR